MEVNDELRNLLLTDITLAFDESVNGKFSDQSIGENELVSLQLPALEQQMRTILVPLYLVRAAVVVISNWHDKKPCYENTVQTETKLRMRHEELFARLLGYLISPAPSSLDKCISGLATAARQQDNTPVSSIEDVSS